MSTPLIVRRADREDGVVVLSPSGLLDLLGTSRLHRAIAKAIVDLPPAVLVVLHDVEVRKPVALSLFAAAAREAAEGKVRLGVVSADQKVLGILRALRLVEQIAVGATVDETVVNLGTPPATVRTQLRLPASRAAPTAARAWLRTAADSWGLPAALADDAVLVLGELVTNAVVHVGEGEILAQLSYRAGALRITVRDKGPMVHLRIRVPHPDEEYGRGLALVGALSRRWGVSRPGGGDGKAVWALLPA